MARTFIRQETQIRNSDVYDDTVAAGSTLESGSTHLESDLNAIRSQLKRAIWDDAAGNWYDDVPTVNGKKRGLADLGTDLDDLEEKRLLFRSQILTDITVGAGNNYVVLSQASSETPSEAAAVSGTAVGAIVATLAGDVGSHSLNEVAGSNAINPKNLLLIRDGATGDPITSSSREIYGLLQAESGTADGEAFNDTTKQAQISFVRINAAGSDLEAVPVADIEGKAINYSYVRRIKFDDVPENAFLSGVFIDNVPTSVSVTLDTAVDNQVGAVTQTDRDIDWRITDTYAFRFQDSAGAVNLFAVLPGAGGDEIEMNVATLDINVGSGTVDVDNGITVDSAGTALSLGVTAGNVASAGLLTLASGGGADLTIDAAGEVIFDDTNKTGSTYSAALKLSETTAEWDLFETRFGEVSLLNAISQAAIKENRSKSVAMVTTNVNEDVNVTGAGGSPNLDAQLGDYSGVTFLSDVDVFVNGVLMRNGADASANHDVYPGTTPANGDLRFEFKLKTNDVITMIIFGV